MHREQACNLFDGNAAIGIGLYAETRRPRGTLAEDKTLWMIRGMLILHFNGLLSSVYQG